MNNSHFILGDRRSPSQMLLAPQFRFTKFLASPPSDTSVKRHKTKQFFFLVLFFCTKNTQWVLGLKGEERLRC